MLAKSTVYIMPEYAPMLHVSYYAQNYAGIIRQGLEVTLCCGENCCRKKRVQKYRYSFTTLQVKSTC